MTNRKLIIFSPGFTELWCTNKNCIYLRYTMWGFHMHIHCEMISTIKLTNTSITSSDNLILWWKCLRSTLLASCKYTMQYLTRATMMHIRSPEHIHHITEGLYLLTNFSPTFQLLETTILCSITMNWIFSLDSIYKWEYVVFLFVSGLFTWHNILQVYSCCCKWQDFLLF